MKPLVNLIVIVTVVLCIYGYSANIYKLLQADFYTPVKEESLRITGIFMPPIGIYLGYVNFD